jgi:peroxiredoxin
MPCCPGSCSTRPGELQLDRASEVGRQVAHGISIHYLLGCVRRFLWLARLVWSVGLIVEPGEGCVLDGVVGRTEGRGVGEVQVGDVLDLAAVEDRGCEDVYALGDLGCQMADELGAEEFAGDGVAGDALGDGCGAWVVDLVVVGFRAGCERVVSGCAGFGVAESGGCGDQFEDPYDLGDQAAAFTATAIDGAQVKLPAGKPVVLLFMATWCRPQLEATALDRIERELGNKITVLGVDVDPKEPAGDLQAFADSIHARYSYVHDTTGALTTAYAVQAMDSTVVIDAAGRIVYRDTVPTDEATLRGALAKATGAGRTS